MDRFQREHSKAEQDVKDVELLLYRQPGALTDTKQKQHCANCLRSLMEHSSWSQEVWEQQLGIEFTPQ